MRSLLDRTARSAADRCLKSATLIVLLRANRVDKVTVAVAAVQRKRLLVEARHFVRDYYSGSAT